MGVLQEDCITSTVRHMLPNNEEWLLIVRSGRAGFAIMAAAFAIDAVVS